MSRTEIKFEFAKGVATLTLNRPDIRNAITGAEIIAEVQDAVAQVNSDKDCRVLIITAADPSFSAGGNVKDMAAKAGMFGGTPAQVRLRSLYNAEYDEGIIIERGWIKKQRAEGKAKMYDFRASQIRAAAPVVEAGGEVSRAAAFMSLSGEALKDTGVFA